MHYAAVISDLIPHPTSRRRRRVRDERGSTVSMHVPAAARGAWRNWWTMSVADEPPYSARQSTVIGARGRMVPPH